MWYLLDTTMIPSGLFWETISTIPMHKIKLQFVHFVNQVTHQVPNCIKLDIWLLPSLMDGWLQMNHILYPSSSSNEVNCSLSILSRHQNNMEFLECILTYYIANSAFTRVTNYSNLILCSNSLEVSNYKMKAYYVIPYQVLHFSIIKLKVMKFSCQFLKT